MLTSTERTILFTLRQHPNHAKRGRAANPVGNGVYVASLQAFCIAATPERLDALEQAGLIGLHRVDSHPASEPSSVFLTESGCKAADAMIGEVTASIPQAAYVENLVKSHQAAQLLAADLREAHKSVPEDQPALEILLLELLGRAAALNMELNHLARRYETVVG